MNMKEKNENRSADEMNVKLELLLNIAKDVSELFVGLGESEIDEDGFYKLFNKAEMSIVEYLKILLESNQMKFVDSSNTPLGTKVKVKSIIVDKKTDIEK